MPLWKWNHMCRRKRIAISCRYDNIYSKKHTTSDMSYTGGAWKKTKMGIFICGSTKAAALMQMIIEEIQLRQANYRYTVSTLAFNLVLFFDRLDNENIKFQNNSRETSDYTRKIISYIELHYMEDIGGKDFARACNLSETHMRRIFIESANITPSEYLNLVRIKKACEMLAKEKCSIEKVSNSVGYPVISTFMRNFKKITGISPNAWRRKALENPENVAAYQVSVFKGW